MDNVGISHQTLKEFIEAPFGVPNMSKNLKYEDRYQSYKRNNKIKIESSIEFEKNFFIHLKVPSESQEKMFYDVVIQFFTTDDKIERQLTVENYYVQFFSNSPGFVYKYATLYKLQGYLIESLYGKFDSGTLEILPDKSNSSYELYYDSSIYYACRYLLDNKLTTLGKLTLKLFKTKSVESFFGDIQDTESMSIQRQINDVEKSLRKEIAKDNTLSDKALMKLKKNDTFKKQINGKKHAKKSTFKDSSKNSKVISRSKKITGNKKRTSSKSTSKK